MATYSEYQQRRMDQTSGEDLDRRLESARRIGLALGQIEEAMGFLEDTNESDARKALVRAKTMLETGDIPL